MKNIKVMKKEYIVMEAKEYEEMINDIRLAAILIENYTENVLLFDIFDSTLSEDKERECRQIFLNRIGEVCDGLLTHYSL